MNQYVYLAPAVLAGLVIPFQAAINARLGHHLGHPVFGALTNFLVGLVAIGIIAAVFSKHFQGWQRASTAPLWLYAGGLLGVTFVFMSLLAVPKLGAANLLVAAVAGQLVASLLIDQFGLVGLPTRAITLPRALGVVLVVAGLLLVTREWGGGRSAAPPSTAQSSESKAPDHTDSRSFSCHRPRL